MNILSAAHSARRLWRTTPTPDQLPHLRSVSDIAWAFWRRATSPTTHSVANIKYLFVTVVMNDETARLIETAHAGLTPPRSGLGVWPGIEFGMDGDAGAAILGLLFPVLFVFSLFVVGFRCRFESIADV
jgi:hypothetical protein